MKKGASRRTDGERGVVNWKEGISFFKSLAATASFRFACGCMPLTAEHHERVSFAPSLKLCFYCFASLPHPITFI